MKAWFLPAIFIPVVWGLWGLLPKLAVRHMSASHAMVYQVGGAVIFGIILLASPDLPDLRLVRPTGSQTALLVTLGIIGTLAHLLMTWSLKFAPASTLAPMQYLEIPFATLIGWLFFGDLPNGLAAAGIAVTIGTGLYIIHRERIVQRNQRLRAAPPAG